MPTVYFVRHGQTEFNLQRRLQGWNDSPLSAQGIAQARILARALTPLGIQSALVSPLGRARQTAAIIHETAGIPLESTPALREVSFGAFEGNTLDELEIHFPGMWAERMADKWNYRPPQGESNAEAVPRAREVVRWIETHANGGPRLIIAHFAINRIILSLLADLSPGETIEMNVPHTVIYRAKKQDGNWLISHRDAEDSQDEFQSGWLRQSDPAKPMGG
ncbi:MAG TPA: histidine phosphatase family protein [bacterium]|nr:histidine phosphatase family protein [bacterium]